MSLPEGLLFLEFGWWIVHLVSVPLIFFYGYRKGRDDERRESGAAAKAKPKSSGL